MKKGFTLIELMGVITIMGIIALVAFPPLLRQIKNSKSKIDEATEKLIIASSSNYVEENKNSFPKIEGETYCITLQTLADDNKLSKDLKNSNGDNIDLNKYVKVDIINNNYSYTVTDSCTN